MASSDSGPSRGERRAKRAFQHQQRFEAPVPQLGPVPTPPSSFPSLMEEVADGTSDTHCF